MPKTPSTFPDDPLWYKDAIVYQVHVKSFADSDGNGIGDFRGLTQKLDYLQGLGVTAIWLLPFYPSPMRDDGYDIADYYRINPQYGTLRDFQTFLREAHARGLRVITELVLNHTSDQHAWFQRSRRAKPGSVWRDFYVWSDTPQKFQDARIIFTDFETSNWAWDAEAKAYYWHRFYSHQPDLNFDNPRVIKEMFKVVDYWFAMGVDGVRLDAIPYLFEREGTNCENLPETLQLLEQLRAHIDGKFKDKMLLAEANQWPEDVIAYFGSGNRCHMAFHFPVMPRLFMATWMEDRFPIIDIFEQTPAIPPTCQWATFLRNHDELTLEMVSDEERDYMYRIYARDPTARINLGIRRRLAPLLGNNRRKIELMNILLLSLPGTPIVYYGDEIGMGDNHYLGDRNGVRTPMQWSADRNAGFSRANPQKLYLPIIIDPEYHYEAINVDNQERNQSSMLWWMRRVLATRKRHKAFGRGTIEFLNSDNPKVIAFVREYEDERILVVVNLSRFSQVANFDAARFAGYTPEEVVSGNRFPPIKESPYTLTLGFYDYYWFALRKETVGAAARARTEISTLQVADRWDTVLQGRLRERLESELQSYVRSCRWFGGKSRAMQQLKIIETITVGQSTNPCVVVLLDVRYTEGSPEVYMLPLAFTRDADRMQALNESPHAIVARLKVGTTDGLLFDGTYDPGFRKQLLTVIARRGSIKARNGRLIGQHGEALRGAKLNTLPLDSSQVLKVEQSNTSIVYGSEFFLKLFRKMEEGPNPDLEITRYLTEQTSFANVPVFAGALEYHAAGSDALAVGILQKLVANQGDAWTFTLNSISSYFERVLEKRSEIGTIPAVPSSAFAAMQVEIPPLMQELIGGVYLEMTKLLGKRTAELHHALAAETRDRAFAPEPFSVLYQRSLFHSMRSMTRRVFETLRKHSRLLDEAARGEIEAVLKREKDIIARFQQLSAKKIDTAKIRIHGDYHLGQVLFTGNDFVIIDFEGEPARSLGERRLKRSPLRDVAGMIRSYEYPGTTILRMLKSYSPEDLKWLETWSELWSRNVGAAFLKSYLATAAGATFLPKDPAHLELLLNLFLLEKAVYEVGYELNNRPEWVMIPLKGIRQLLG
jgi:maltose alpha-D-glucosyltransferase/alpha-amylase